MQVIAHKPNKNHGGGCRRDCDRKDSSKCPFFHQENLHESFRSHIKKERRDMKHGIFVGSFSSAMECLKCGEPIKRPGWIGYWIIRNGKLEMHCKDGSILDICKLRNGQRNILLRKWDRAGKRFYRSAAQRKSGQQKPEQILHKRRG